MEIENLKNDLSRHPAYELLGTIEGLRLFMQTHVFAVWDFMSLLKSLQRKLTSTTHPWRPSPYSKKVVRLINEIVLGEESDQFKESYSDHFSLYLAAMKEVGANTSEIADFLETLETKNLSPHIRQFVEYNLELAEFGEAHLVASAFFHGREGLIPSMFTTIKNVLHEHQIQAPVFIYYLERHIDLDGEEHGPAGELLLEELYQGDASKIRAGNQVAAESLRRRSILWDGLISS
jgi:hypothetical protein